MSNSYDDLNEKFLSKEINKLLLFFASFQNREELISWMHDRPKSHPDIKIVDGNDLAVVVIPTSNINSYRAINCRDSVFKGIRQIYVESQKPVDHYFNYSHNVNIGVKAAMKFNPEWIIISNDDVILMDKPESLLNGLRDSDSNTINTLFTDPPGLYHSFPRFIGSPNYLYGVINKFSYNNNRKIRYKLWKQFEVQYIDALQQGALGFLSRRTYRKIKPHLLTGSFTILSSKFVSEQKDVLDETFINGGEDTDLSLRLYETPNKIGTIKYRIGDMIGASLGNGWDRIIRNVSNEAYLSYKIETGLLKV